MKFFNLALLAGATTAVEFTSHHPYQPVSHSGYDFGSLNNHVKVQNYRNPFDHIIEHHTYADSYENDPWATRNEGGDVGRSGWYSPYQQFSPAKIPYKPTVTRATFARCEFEDIGTVLLGQLKGKSVIVKLDNEIFPTSA